MIEDTQGIVDTVDLWKISPCNKDVQFLNRIIFVDVEGMEYLAPFVTGFMVCPVALYKGKPIEALQRRMDDIRELKKELEVTNRKIFLYQLHWVPSYPYYKELDSKLNVPVTSSDGPYVKHGFWFVRYASVD